jgi:hypothetical protein
MYFKFLTFLFVVLLLTRETPKLRVSGMSARMIRDGVPTHRVAEYVRLERQLFEIEKACIEEGENRVHEALVVSKKIRDGYPTYDFGDHAELLKRCAEPHKHKA